MYTCAMCSEHYCKTGELEKVPLNCPCNEKEEQEKIKELYLEEDNYKLAHNSALVEAEGYCKNTRLQEIMEFANKCNFKKLGLAFCVGLSKEAKILCTILRHNGFEVNSGYVKMEVYLKNF